METRKENPITTRADLSKARQALERAKTPKEVKSLLDKAKAAEVYVKAAFKDRADKLEKEWPIAEYRLDCERKLGVMLPQVVKRGRPKKTMSGRGFLDETGITWEQSSHWQLEAQILAKEYERWKAERREAGEDFSSAELRRYARRLSQHEKPETPPLSGTYRTIVLDPPWPMEKVDREKRPRQAKELDYPVMSLEEIEALEIPKIAASDGCHVYLWVTHKFLPAGLDLFIAWGVSYECVLTWVKPTGFTPFSWLYNTEHCLFGRVGSLQVSRKGLKLGFSASVGKSHSTKPDEFYTRVMEASPGPRLEMFARTKRDGFKAWGNEIS